VVRRTMIDTGFHGVRRDLVAAVASLGVQGAIVTHWHEDHAGNVAALARLGLPIQLGGDTESMLRSPPDIQLYRRAIWGQLPRLEYDIVSFESRGLTRVHTPGHSEDHHVVWDAET